MKIITAVLVMAAGALSAQERVREFEPFNRFMERTRFASSMDLRSPRARFGARRRLTKCIATFLKTYGVVEVKHSFVREGSHFDCVPVNQQPAVRELALESIAEAPPQALLPNAGAAEMSARAAEELPVDEFGNAMGLRGVDHPDAPHRPRRDDAVRLAARVSVEEAGGPPRRRTARRSLLR
jgi:hypothetical protein